MFSGLIYFHRIIDPRITGSAKSNIRLFNKLCGRQNLGKVVLATTFWDEVEPTIGNKREALLMSNPQFWQPMVDGGSVCFRLNNNQSQNLRVVSHIAQLNQKFFVEAQHEMLAGKALHETAAATNSGIDLATIQAQHEQRLKNEAAELRRAQESKILEQQREAERVREQLRKERLEQQRRQQRQQEIEEEARRRKGEEQKMERERELDRIRINLAQQRAEEEQAEERRYWAAYQCYHSPFKRYQCDNCGERLDRWGVVCYRESN